MSDNDRKLRSGGTTSAVSLDKTKKYKLNTAGSLVEATTEGDTDIIFSGSKSSLRRIADLERNISILAARTQTEDGSGDGSGGGTVEKASKWANARTITLGGDLSGSVSIDGSANVTLNATVAGNTVALGTDTTGNYMVNVSAGTGISVSHTQGEGSTATISSTITQYTDALARGAVSFIAGSGAYNSTTGVFTIPTNTSQLTNGASFITLASLSAGTGISYNSSTGAISTSAIPNSSLSNSSVTVGTTAISLGSSSTTLAGLTSVTSTGFTGALTGNASTATTLQTARNIQGVSFNGSADITVVTAGTGISVSGTAVTNTLSTSGGSIGGAIAVTGAITATGEVTAYYSDLRLKTNIVPIADALDKVEAISGVTFDPNEDALALGIDDRHQMGVIAQEVEAVAPELVCDSAFKGYKTVRYDKLTALLIEAVKELSAKVKTLEAQIGRTGEL